MTRATDEHASVSLPAAPLSWQIIGGFVVTCAAAIVLFLGAVVHTRKEPAGGASVNTLRSDIRGRM